VAKTGTGTVTLSAANSYSGGTTITNGVLNLNNAGALGTGALTISGGTLDNTSGSFQTLANANPLNFNAGFAFAGTTNLNLGAGAVTLNTNVTITVTNNRLTLGGSVASTGNFSLTKAGSGELEYTGSLFAATNGFTVNAGSLILGGSTTFTNTSSGTNPGAVTYQISAGARLIATNNGTTNLFIADRTDKTNIYQQFNIYGTNGAADSTAAMVVSNGATLTITNNTRNSGGVSQTNALVLVGSNGTFNFTHNLSGYVMQNGSTIKVDQGGVLRITPYSLDLGKAGVGTNMITNAGTFNYTFNGNSMNIGSGASGLNAIYNTGIFNATGGSFIRIGSASNATATNMLVNYEGATANLTGIGIGSAAAALNTLSNGGMLTTTYIYVGDNSNGTVNSLTNSGTISMSGDLRLGQTGGTNNSVVNSGTITSGTSLIVGNSTNARGVNAVTNTGTMSFNNTSTVGAAGSNNILFNAGSITINTGFIVGGTGAAGLNEATNASTGTITAGSMTVGNGTAATANNRLINEGTVRINGATTVGTGGSNNLYVNSGTSSNSGALIVGNGATGINTVSNTGTMTVYQIQIGGTSTTAGATNTLISSGTLIYTGLQSGANYNIGNSVNATGLNELRLTGGIMSNSTAVSAPSLILGNAAAATGTNIFSLSGGAQYIGYATSNVANWRHINIGNAGSQYNLLTNNGGSISNIGQIIVGSGSSNNANTAYLGNGTITALQNSMAGVFVGGGGTNQVSRMATNTFILASGGVLTQNSSSIGAFSVSNNNTFDIQGGQATLNNFTFGAATANYTNGATILTAAGNTNTLNLGAGTLTANQFLAGAASSAAGDSNMLTFNGGTLQAGTSSQTSFLASNIATVTINEAGGTIDSGTRNITVSASISGVGVLTKSGTSVLTLSGSNSFAGGIRILDGSVSVANPFALGGGAITNSSGTLVLATNLSTTTVSLGNGSITGASFALDSTGVTATNSGAALISSRLTGTGAALTMNGAGTLTLSASNSYTGGTTINNGTLLLTSTNAAGTGGVSLSGGSTIGFSNAAASTLANDITVSSGTGIIRSYGANTLTLAGTLTKQGSILQFFGGSYNVTGKITGATGSFDSDLVLTNGASVTLSRAADYFGPTYVTAGSTLTAGVGNALPTSTVLYLGSGGESSSLTNSYNLNGNSQTLGGLTSAGNGVNQIYNNSGTQSLLTLSGSSTFGGSINGNIALAVSGGSSVNLSGISDYIGATTISGSSSLNLGTSGSLTGTSNVIVSAGSTLLLGANNQVNSAAQLTLAGGTISMGANGSTRAGSQSFNSLTLTGNSVIDFANLAGNSTLSFSQFVMDGNSLRIYNWSGAQSETQIGTQTRLLSASGLSQSDLNNISFFSGSGTGFIGNGFWSGGEIVPVPEPTVVIAALMLLAWLLVANRGTLLAFLRRRS
jgi:autotransporter-associated beta strand protein